MTPKKFFATWSTKKKDIILVMVSLDFKMICDNQDELKKDLEIIIEKYAIKK